MTFIGLFYAAQTGSDAACHGIFQRYFTFNIVSFGIFGYSYHHWFGTTSVNHIKLIVFQNTVHCHITFFSHTSVFSSGIYIAELLELFQLQHPIGKSACSPSSAMLHPDKASEQYPRHHLLKELFCQDFPA